MYNHTTSKLAQTHVALTGPTWQQVLQLMMTRLTSKGHVNTSLNRSGLLRFTHSTNEITTQTEWNNDLREG